MRQNPRKPPCLPSSLRALGQDLDSEKASLSAVFAAGIWRWISSVLACELERATRHHEEAGAERRLAAAASPAPATVRRHVAQERTRSGSASPQPSAYRKMSKERVAHSRAPFRDGALGVRDGEGAFTPGSAMTKAPPSSVRIVTVSSSLPAAVRRGSYHRGAFWRARHFFARGSPQKNTQNETKRPHACACWYLNGAIV